MVLLRLARFPISLFSEPPSLLSPKPNSLLRLSRFTTRTSTFKPLIPTLSISTAAEPIPTPTSEADHGTPHLETSLDKLFVPPETDVGEARILKGSNIVLSKYARDAQVDQAEFVKSSVRTEDCPSDGLPEFALVGRSNVGKSSLLNSLVRRKRLALTSKKPGKTQCINHFRINDSWYLVDLPGYGARKFSGRGFSNLKRNKIKGWLPGLLMYASAPQELRTDWAKFTKDYFLNRSTLVSVFLLIDASIPAKSIDLEYASWLGQNQIPMTLIFTKCDKRKKKKNGGKRPEENVNDFQESVQGFFKSAPPWIMTSSVTNQGRDEILLHMAQLRNYWLEH